MIKPEEMFDFDLRSSRSCINKEDKEYLAEMGYDLYYFQCIKLEKLYNEMMNSYDIRTGHTSTTC